MSLRKVIDSGARVGCPSWLPDNLCYETIMGSDAYGVSSGASDTDVYGICFPLKETVFPHLAGEIFGFGNQIQRFNTWQQHHIRSLEKEWDFQIYGIVKFFQLAMDCNPNIIDSLYTPRRCVLSATQVGEYIRENRKDFLSKAAWPKFKGYAYAQMNKIQTKTPKEDSKRFESVQEHGYDVKYSYHLVRLLLEVEQILTEQSLDLERHREQLKAIRRGEWSLVKLTEWAQDKEKALEAIYSTSDLQWAPNEPVIKKHLVHCLESHYGDLSKAVVQIGEPERLLREIAKLASKYS